MPGGSGRGGGAQAAGARLGSAPVAAAAGGHSHNNMQVRLVLCPRHGGRQVARLVTEEWLVRHWISEEAGQVVV